MATAWWWAGVYLYHDERAMRALIVELTSGPAEIVAILPPNEDGDDGQEFAIEAFGEWSGWTETRFYGHNINAALAKAALAKRKFLREKSAGKSVHS